MTHLHIPHPLVRPAARVLLIDRHDHILLLPVDATDPPRRVWITPGGGLETPPSPIVRRLRALTPTSPGLLAGGLSPNLPTPHATASSLPHANSPASSPHDSTAPSLPAPFVPAVERTLAVKLAVTRVLTTISPGRPFLTPSLDGDPMTLEELQAWLIEHLDDIASFMDYEASLDDEATLAATLDAWFDSEHWRSSDHRFIHLGIDGTGGQFAAWIAPGSAPPYPIVLFGSEGGAGVLCASPSDWAQILAHAPVIDDLGEPASVLPADDDDDLDEEAEEALESYRAAVENHFDAWPSLLELTEDLESLNEQFLEWVNDHRPS